MKTFIYTATDVQGNTVKNAKMSAEDVNDFLEKIHEKGLFCSSYKETNSKASNTLHKFTTKELSTNCRQLSAMLTSGLTLVKALDILYKEQEKNAQKQIFREIYEEVQKGSSFSDALKMQQGAFPNFMVAMIQAGEVSGNLDVIVKRLEENYAKEAKLNNKIKGALMYPIILAGGGLLGCLLGLLIIQLRKMGDNPSKELNGATYVSASLTLLFGLGSCFLLFRNVDLPSSFLLGWASPWASAVLGILSGVAIGIITEYYTSTDFKPTQILAGMATEGEAFVITKGDAIGSRSCLLPVLFIAISLFVSGKICGTYGIALASLGMLSFVGTTVSIDAFGPIADNAGGLAESCHLPHEVRIITDKLDAVGKTTAAIGKGFAIGSSAFATVSLIVAYVGSYSTGEPILNFASFVVVAGGILGGALVEYFSAILTDNTIDSAKKMADDGDKLLSIPGVLEGKVKPDYNVMIRTATEEALRKMLFPSILALVIPVVGGLLFGVEFIGGLLVGATIVAIPRAIFMGNSGGAFDNAKKFIEEERLPGHGKGSAAHKAAVTGDTVGDTRKDVVGVALDIFIKSMSTVANTLGGVIRNFTLIK